MYIPAQAGRQEAKGTPFFLPLPLCSAQALSLFYWGHRSKGWSYLETTHSQSHPEIMFNLSTLRPGHVDTWINHHKGWGWQVPFAEQSSRRQRFLCWACPFFVTLMVPSRDSVLKRSSRNLSDLISWGHYSNNNNSKLSIFYMWGTSESILHSWLHLSFFLFALSLFLKKGKETSMYGCHSCAPY